MSTPTSLTQPSRQIWGAKENAVTNKLQTQLAIAQSVINGSIINGAIYPSLPSCYFPRISIGLTNNLLIMVTETLPSKTSNKERALALVRNDKSTPKNLRLRAGTVKELSEGVFAKKRANGILEIYISEE